MQKRPIPARVSAASTQVPFHRAGHSSGIHPEDEPYWTDQRNKYPNPLDVADDLDYPDEPRKSRTSAVYYPTTDKHGGRLTSLTPRMAFPAPIK